MQGYQALCLQDGGCSTWKENRPGLLVGRGKKSQISRDFQGQIRGKNGRFRGNFAEIFEASFAEKRLVKNGRFRESFVRAGKRLVLR